MLCLQLVLDAMQYRENSLFVLIGDHGMTEDGNHGGATYEETTSGIFFYSPHRSFSQNYKGGDSSHSGESSEHPAVLQTDLVQYF